MAAVAAKSGPIPHSRRRLPRVALSAGIVLVCLATVLLLSHSFHAAVIFVLGLYMAVFAVARPFALTVGFAAQLPLIPRWGEMLGVRVPDLMAPVAGLVLLGSIISWMANKERQPLRLVWFDGIALAFLIVGRFELYRGPVEVDLAKFYTRSMLVPGMFYLACRLMMLDRRRASLLLRWQLFPGMVLSLILIVEAALHRSFLYGSVAEVFQSAGLYQPGGAFGRPFLAGAYLGMLLPLYLYGAIGGFGRHRNLFIAGTGLALVGVGLSLERGAWLSAAAALIVCALYRPLRRAASAVLAVSVVLAGLALLVSSHSWVQSRVAESANVQDRFRFIQAGIGIISAPTWNPLTGIGEGGYVATAYMYMPPRSYFDDRRPEADMNRAQHNDYLRAFVEHGIPGGLLLLLMLVLIIGRGVNLARARGGGETGRDGRLGIALVASALAVFVNMGTHNTLVESQLMSVFWLMCAILYSDDALRKELAPASSLPIVRRRLDVPA